ncbi:MULTISPECIES: glycosyltransferase family 2 protein [Arthrobacter]|uniref:Glycosyltransferase family 2 protein n=2 Tax=Arthrobacter TaxID=1663 RepID=A0ABU9KQC7_9MICC|nr:glycosyltransferase family 2 protein [Arthrobacter sp. YJM1]MDP5227713.1 glycosyltransferase family 2 protein [Arthrobacter sp. YJM1]
MVRDEADIIAEVVRHQLAQGLDFVLVADNGSADGTLEILEKMARADHRILVAKDSEPRHFQSEKITYLAWAAWRNGAKWVVPFDGDEFFFAEGELLGDFLRRMPDEVTVVHADFHHMVPIAGDGDVGPSTKFMMDGSASFPGKICVRTHPLLEIIEGNHDASRVGGRRSGVAVAHAIYRSPAQMARKFRQGLAAADGIHPGSHWVKGAVVSDRELDTVWELITHGFPAPQIDYLAKGPMRIVSPLAWENWDPKGQLEGDDDVVL